MKFHTWDIKILLFSGNKPQEYSGLEEIIVCSFSKILNTEAEWLPSSKHNRNPNGYKFLH